VVVQRVGHARSGGEATSPAPLPRPSPTIIQRACSIGGRREHHPGRGAARPTSHFRSSGQAHLQQARGR